VRTHTPISKAGIITTQSLHQDQHLLSSQRSTSNKIIGHRQEIMTSVQRVPGGGGQTHLQTPATGPQTTIQAPRQAVLRLRGATREQERDAMEQGESSRARRRIKWAEDVIDNEGLGRKKSKGSCLAHTSCCLSYTFV
jgi:hypothetical protein